MLEGTVKVLVAEDSQLNFELARDVLESAGHEVGWAQDGEQALEMARGQAYELILLDLHMPKRDGLSVLREVRADPELAGTKVVAITADAMPSVRSELEAAGADTVLTKPLELALLLETVSKLGALT